MDNKRIATIKIGEFEFYVYQDDSSNLFEDQLLAIKHRLMNLAGIYCKECGRPPAP